MYVAKALSRPIGPPSLAEAAICEEITRRQRRSFSRSQGKIHWLLMYVGGNTEEKDLL